MDFSSKKITEWWQQQLAHYFLWWSIGVVVLIVGGGSWFILKPLYHDIRENNQAAQLSVRLDATRNQFAQLKLKSDAWAAENQTDAINLILPSYSDLPNLLVELEALADHSKFQLQGIAVAEEAVGANSTTPGGAVAAATTSATSGIRELKVTLNLTNGTYSHLRDFLSLAQSAWRLVAVQSINFGTDSSYAIELTSYYYTH